MRDGDAADGSRVTGKRSPECAGQEERVQGIRGHTAPEFRIQQDSKHFEPFLLSINEPMRSATQLLL